MKSIFILRSNLFKFKTVNMLSFYLHIVILIAGTLFLAIICTLGSLLIKVSQGEGVGGVAPWKKSKKGTKVKIYSLNLWRKFRT
jgi:hypothetical protein